MNMHTENRKDAENDTAEHKNEATYGGMRYRLTLDAYEGKKKSHGMEGSTRKTIGTVLMFLLIVMVVSVGIIITGILFMKNAESRAFDRLCGDPADAGAEQENVFTVNAG